MRKIAFLAGAALASTILLAGCTPTAPSSSTKPTAKPTASAAPSAVASPPPTACDAGALSYLDGVATKRGTSPTRLTEPTKAGYPEQIAEPGCAVQWTTADGKPGYGGIYFNATDSTFTDLLESLKNQGITTTQVTPGTGMSKAYDLELLAEKTLVQGGYLLEINSGASPQITAPIVLFVWEHFQS
jgi:hypothetical protein